MSDLFSQLAGIELFANRSLGGLNVAQNPQTMLDMVNYRPTSVEYYQGLIHDANYQISILLRRDSQMLKRIQRKKAIEWLNANSKERTT